jgi:hypothetical protein
MLQKMTALMTKTANKMAIKRNAAIRITAGPTTLNNWSGSK